MYNKIVISIYVRYSSKIALFYIKQNVLVDKN